MLSQLILVFSLPIIRSLWPVKVRHTSSSASMFVCVKSCDLSPWCELRNYWPTLDVQSREVDKCIDKKIKKMSRYIVLHRRPRIKKSLSQFVEGTR